MSESKHIASLNHDRIFGFDILRACAIIFVVAVHGRFLVEGTFLYDFPYLIFAFPPVWSINLDFPRRWLIDLSA